MISVKSLVVCVFVAFCLAGLVFAGLPNKAQSGGYNPWCDVDDNGIINTLDLYKVARLYGATGTPAAKASIEYDSGWINITDKAGQNIMVTHGLNIADWNDENIDVSNMGKTSPDGRLLRYLGLTGQIKGWNETYGGTSDDEASALVQTVDGGYALAGYTRSLGAGNSDFWLVKTDSAGNEQWNKTYGGKGWDEANALVQTVDGGYALAGLTTSYGAGSADAWLVKTDVEGGLAWVDSSANTITLYRGITDVYWNFVRVRIWKPKPTP